MRKLIKTAIKTIGKICISPQIKPKPANLQAFYQIQIISSDGKIRFDTHLRESHSFVFQFLQMLQGCFRAATSITGIIDVGGTSRTFSKTYWDSYAFIVVNAGVGISTYGIVVGSGTAAESNTDIALDTQIAHGVGAGQLQYGVHSYVATQVVGANVDYEVNRMFINASGGSVTINEIGIYSYSSGFYACIVRDLTGGIIVPNGESIIVRYTLRTTV